MIFSERFSQYENECPVDTEDFNFIYIHIFSLSNILYIPTVLPRRHTLHFITINNFDKDFQFLLLHIVIINYLVFERIFQVQLTSKHIMLFPGWTTNILHCNAVPA